jgi:D-lactate dehydrogenase
MAARTVTNVLRWTNGGELALVIDATSCAHGLKAELAASLDEATAARWAAVEVIDPVAWIAGLLPSLDVKSRVARAAVHPTCSSKHLGNPGALAEVARAIADEVVVPLSATCCGFAGDRGMLHPELTASATRAEASEVAQAGADVFLSANRTCEIGLEQATGRPYESVVLALERATR